MRRLILAAVVLVLLAATAIPAGANAFTMAERSLLGRLGVSYFLTSSYYDKDGEVQTSENNLFYRDMSVPLDLRWAWNDMLELGLNTRFRHQFLSDDFDDQTTNAMGDLNLDARWRMLGGHRGALAISGLVKLPYFYDPDADLPAGDGQVDAEGRVLGAARVSLLTLGADGGYRYRAGDPADVWVYGAEVDFAHRIVYGGVRLDGVASVGNEEDDAEPADFRQGPNYAVGNLNVMFGIKATNHLSFDFTFTHTMYGRNVAYGSTFLLGANLIF